MTEDHRISEALTEQLAIIEDCWAELTEPSASPSVGAATSDVITPLDRRISLAHEVTLTLNGWARVVVEDRPVTHYVPLGSDTLGLVVFLRRHALWLSGHEAARDALDEIRSAAHRVETTARPPKPEWVYLGDCPFVVEDWFCSGRVRVRIGDDSTMAACSDCEQTGFVEWWEQVLGIDTLPKAVHAPELAKLIYTRLHVRVTERTVRNWERDGQVHAIEAFGPQPAIRRYDPRSVITEVALLGRACPSCGRLWGGFGNVCLACFSAELHARPRRASERLSTPAPRPLPFVGRIDPPADPVEVDEEGMRLCDRSDLPQSWCACEAHRHRQWLRRNGL